MNFSHAFLNTLLEPLCEFAGAWCVWGACCVWEVCCICCVCCWSVIFTAPPCVSFGALVIVSLPSPDLGLFGFVPGFSIGVCNRVSGCEGRSAFCDARALPLSSPPLVVPSPLLVPVVDCFPAMISCCQYSHEMIPPSPT